MSQLISKTGAAGTPGMSFFFWGGGGGEGIAKVLLREKKNTKLLKGGPATS